MPLAGSRASFVGVQSAQPSSLRDRRGRPLTDLRLSVTDRCNFRCRYCMPREEFDPGRFLKKAELLSFEELERVSARFVELGVRKIRITGGEPLLRRELPRLVEKLSRLEVDLALTTNGVLLPRFAGALRDAGLQRLTVSLDSLDEALFQELCDAPGFGPADVLAGIEAATTAGFSRIKINCVVRRGKNEHEIASLARHFSTSGHVVRFIEYMDVGTRHAFEPKDVVPGVEILDQLRVLGEPVPVGASSSSDVAKRFQLGGQEVGLITSMSAPFCGACSRIRLSADGGLFTCLFAGVRHDLKGLLRAGCSDEDLVRRIRAVWSGRQDRYSELRTSLSAEEQPLARGAAETPLPASGRTDGARHLPVLPRVEMSFIGG